MNSHFLTTFFLLNQFLRLKKFYAFNFSGFLAIFLLLLALNLSILLLPILNYLKVNFSNNTVIFSIKINCTAILLKP